MSRGVFGGAGSGGTVDVSGKLDKAAYTAKGDILVASGQAQPTVVPIGANGSSLVADSTRSTGVRWEPTIASSGNVLAWTGSDYAPSSLKADTSKPRIFIGPTDPVEVPGVVINSTSWYDTWIGGA